MDLKENYLIFAKIGKNVKIFPNSVFINSENIEIGDYSHIDDFVFFNGGKKSIIGRNVHIACFTSIIGGGELIIEDFAGISAGCRIITGSDDFSGESLTNLTIPKKFRNITLGRIIIKKHALLGSNVIVMPNVRIGEGCIVGAGGVVTRNLKDWTIYSGGGFVRAIGKRDKEKIYNLEKQYLKEMQ